MLFTPYNGCLSLLYSSPFLIPSVLFHLLPPPPSCIRRPPPATRFSRLVTTTLYHHCPLSQSPPCSPVWVLLPPHPPVCPSFPCLSAACRRSGITDTGTRTFARPLRLLLSPPFHCLRKAGSLQNTRASRCLLPVCSCAEAAFLCPFCASHPRPSPLPLVESCANRIELSDMRLQATY